MNKRLLAILALTLCVGALLFPVTAYAASDTTPPVVNAWISGDSLHVEASDNDGVEAAYIGGARVNYRVDGAFDVPLKDYAGSGEYITVYAVDFAGNKSNEVKIKNPYYTAPTATPAPTTPAATQKPASTSTPAATATPAPTETPGPTESSVPADPQPADGLRPFTPDGTGTVMDNVVEQNGKEFFTITTADDNTFYLIIDRERSSENVYLLNAVTEDDLMALAQKSDGTTQSAVPTPEPTPQQTQPTPEPTPEPDPKTPGGNNTGAILIILLAVLGVGGAGYYFKILKPKQEAASGDGEDEYDDEDDYDGESDYSDDSEDDYGGYDSGDDDSGDMKDDEE